MDPTKSRKCLIFDLFNGKSPIFTKKLDFVSLVRGSKNGRNDCGRDRSRVLISIPMVEPG